MDRKLIYRCEDGVLLGNIPSESEHGGLYSFKTGYILINDNNFNDFMNYRVVNNELIELTEIEKSEVRSCGRILTVEERLLIKLRPSSTEIGNAKQTINTINLIQELIL